MKNEIITKIRHSNCFVFLQTRSIEGQFVTILGSPLIILINLVTTSNPKCILLLKYLKFVEANFCGMRRFAEIVFRESKYHIICVSVWFEIHGIGIPK